MSEQLTEGRTGASAGLRAPVVWVLIVVASYAVVGAAAGWLWHALWNPTVGRVIQGGWYPDEAGLRGDFSGTGLYVLIAAGAGLLLGLVVAIFGGRRPMLTLAAVVVGSALAAWLMVLVGEGLSPAEDPHVAAETAKEGDKLPQHVAGLRADPCADAADGIARRRGPGLRDVLGIIVRSRVAQGTARVGFASQDLPAAPLERRPTMGDPVSDTTPPTGGQPPFPGQQSDPLAASPVQQPGQPPQTEYLEAGGGSPIDPEAKPVASGGGRKRVLLIGGAAAVLAVVGVGAWAAVSFLSTGAQPDEALPSSTLGYASIDLDPSGGQKIEALKTLNKFPAFKDEIGLDTDDDIRQRIFEEFEKDAECGLDYAQDIEPWLGDRMAVAAVDTGGNTPAPVFVVQVKDADKADVGLAKVRDCGGDDDALATTGGWVFDGDWAIIAEDQETAQAVSDLTDKGNLADDPEYQDLTSAAGDIGIVNLYVAPEAGQHLADLMGGAGMLGGMGLGGMGLGAWRTRSRV